MEKALLPTGTRYKFKQTCNRVQRALTIENAEVLVPLRPAAHFPIVSCGRSTKGSSP